MSIFSDFLIRVSNKKTLGMKLIIILPFDCLPPDMKLIIIRLKINNTFSCLRLYIVLFLSIFIGVDVDHF